MKIGQTAVVRWVSKLVVAKQPARLEKRHAASLRTLDIELLALGDSVLPDGGEHLPTRGPGVPAHLLGR